MPLLSPSALLAALSALVLCSVASNEALTTPSRGERSSVLPAVSHFDWSSSAEDSSGLEPEWESASWVEESASAGAPRPDAASSSSSSSSSGDGEQGEDSENPSPPDSQQNAESPPPPPAAADGDASSQGGAQPVDAPQATQEDDRTGGDSQNDAGQQNQQNPQDQADSPPSPQDQQGDYNGQGAADGEDGAAGSGEGRAPPRPPRHPVIQELSEELNNRRGREGNPAVFHGDVGGVAGDPVQDQQQPQGQPEDWPAPPPPPGEEEDQEAQTQRQQFDSAMQNADRLAMYFSNAEQTQKEKDLLRSLSFQDKVEEYLSSPEAAQLLDCIKIQEKPLNKWNVTAACTALEGKARDACAGNAPGVAKVMNAIKGLCADKTFSQCLGEVTLPLVHPLFTVFEETSDFGLMTFSNEWFRMVYPGPKGDQAVEDFDRYFLGEPTTVFYGAVLDAKEKLRSKLKKKADGKFGSKEKKEEAVKAYAMAGLLTAAQPPQLEDVLIKMLLDSLDFSGCARKMKVTLKDSEGKKHKVKVDDLRQRALAKAIGRAVRVSSDGTDKIAAHNLSVVDLFMASFPRFQSVDSVIRGEMAGIPPFAFPVSPTLREQLIGYLQDKTAAIVYGYFKLKKKEGAFSKFMKSNKILRKAFIGYMSLVVKLGLPFLKDAVKEAKDSIDTTPEKVLPAINYSPEQVAWAERVRLYARLLVFTGDVGEAEFSSKLAADVLLNTMKKSKKKADKALKKLEKKLAKEEKKAKKEAEKAKKEKEKSQGAWTPEPPKEDTRAPESPREEGHQDEEGKKPSKWKFWKRSGPKKPKKEKAPKEEEGDKKPPKWKFWKRNSPDKPKKEKPNKGGEEEKAPKRWQFWKRRSPGNKQDKEVAKKEKAQQKLEKKQKKAAEKEEKKRKKQEQKRQKQEKKAEKKREKQEKKDQKKREKQEKKDQKKREKQEKKAAKMVAKMQKKPAKELGQNESDDSGSEAKETNFLEVQPSTQQLLSRRKSFGVRRHSPWTYTGRETAMAFIQIGVNLSRRNRVLIALSAALVGCIAFALAISFNLPWAAFVIFLILTVVEYLSLF